LDNKYIFLVYQIGKPKMNMLFQNELTNNRLNLFGLTKDIYFRTLNADGVGTTKKIVIQILS
jgi:hypothetical protein